MTGVPGNRDGHGTSLPDIRQSAAGRRIASGVPRARALAFRQPLARRQRGAVKTYVIADLHWPGRGDRARLRRARPGGRFQVS